MHAWPAKSKSKSKGPQRKEEATVFPSADLSAVASCYHLSEALQVDEETTPQERLLVPCPRCAGYSPLPQLRLLVSEDDGTFPRSDYLSRRGTTSRLGNHRSVCCLFHALACDGYSPLCSCAFLISEDDGTFPRSEEDTNRVLDLN